LRKDVQKPSFIVLDIDFFLDFAFHFTFLHASIGTAIEVKKSN
jgi:hypothetical protein